jgi:hypothetical protein
MLLAHLVINAVDAALDDRKEAFNGIGVSVKLRFAGDSPLGGRWIRTLGPA